MLSGEYTTRGVQFMNSHSVNVLICRILAWSRELHTHLGTCCVKLGSSLNATLGGINRKAFNGGCSVEVWLGHPICCGFMLLHAGWLALFPCEVNRVRHTFVSCMSCRSNSQLGRYIRGVVANSSAYDEWQVDIFLSIGLPCCVYRRLPSRFLGGTGCLG